MVDDAVFYSDMSLPAWGVWIEIDPLPTLVTAKGMVAPRMGSVD